MNDPTAFPRKKRREIDLDMTPMVDVVFLLLIFFMLTASFAMQKSIEIPPPEWDDEPGQGQAMQDAHDEGQNIVVRIAADNTIWVEDEKIPNRQTLLGELRRQLDLAPAVHKPTTLVVLADPDAIHETVVSVLDIGNALRIPNIQLATLDEEE